MNTTHALHVRWAVARDLPRVLDIERASFIDGWTEADFRRVLAQRDCILFVAEAGDEIVGYVVYQRRATSLEILNLAVHPVARRVGVGRALVAKLVEKVSQQGRQKLVVNVREGSDAALMLFRKCGLRAVKVTRGLYEGENGVQMERRLSDDEWFTGPPVNRLALYQGE